MIMCQIKLLYARNYSHNGVCSIIPYNILFELNKFFCLINIDEKKTTHIKKIIIVMTNRKNEMDELINIDSNYNSVKLKMFWVSNKIYN